MALPGSFSGWLAARFGSGARFFEPMSRHTSLGVGGPAEAWVAAPDREGLSELLQKCRECGVPWFVTGRGTNLLVGGAGIPGLVLTLGKGFTEISAQKIENGKTAVTAGAGAALSALCKFAAKNSLAGMNFAVGIPGSVGGAVAGNAGTAAGCTADCLTGIEVMLTDSSVKRLPRGELDFSYRRLSRPESLWGGTGRHAVIISASFSLSAGKAEEITSEAEELAARRRAGQPKGVKSAGCFFKNPPGDNAGRLIDKAGLKGKKVGGAVVSPVHANFLVNENNASAEDFEVLVEMVRGEVLEKFGVELELEVIRP